MRAEDLPWPLPVEVPYVVEDGFGSYVEVIAAGAYDGARELSDESRTFVVAKDEWDNDYAARRILRFAAVSRE